jgi:hypothetical protein
MPNKEWCINGRRPVRETATVTPEEAGVQVCERLKHSLDSGLRRNDQYVFDTMPNKASPIQWGWLNG